MSTLDSDGWVNEDPLGLALAAGYDIETYSLARAVSSESGNEPYEVKVAVASAIVNEANRRGVTVFALTTTTRQRGKASRYGRQYHPVSRDSRYVSTAQDPRKEDLEIALKALSDPGSGDRIMGSSRFFKPELQDRLASGGAAGYRSNSRELLASWASEGWGVVAEVGDWLFLRHESVEWREGPYAVAGIGSAVAGWLSLVGAVALGAYAYYSGR